MNIFSKLNAEGNFLRLIMYRLNREFRLSYTGSSFVIFQLEVQSDGGTHCVATVRL